MLQHLQIRNLALLDSAAIDFEAGFTAVTGETGAGKSVFLGALSLLSGSRADKGLIRAGSEQLETEAMLWFADSASIDAALAGMGLPKCEDGSLLLKRSLHVSKASRITINGSLATLSNLQELGPHWIDFHGPGEPQRLLKRECQLELIDLFGQLEDEATAYRERYYEWRATLSEIEKLTGAARLSDDQIDFFKTQLERIDALDLSAENVEQLEIDFNRVSSAQELLALSASVAEGLSGDDGALTALAKASHAAREAAELDPSLAEPSERLMRLIGELQELSREYEDVGDSLNFEPEFADEVQRRMGEWQEVRRKYGRTVAEVLEARNAMSEKLGSQGDVEGALESLHQKADTQERELKTKAAALTRKRETAGKRLAKKAEAALMELGFKKGKCGLEMVADRELTPHGDALPELQFSPNVGEPLKPLAKVASSGELARVMLALKTILADVDHVPVLVFDEVDANVGGEVGRIVGEKMKEIGSAHQVICITHLPQVAALAANHYVAEKDQSGARAAVTISKLQPNGPDRVEELARMLGDRSAKSALSHAKELLAV